MISEAQKKAQEKYRSEKVKRFTVDFYPAEAELWEHLQSLPKGEKQAYIKNLIKNDIKQEPEA